MRWTKHRPKHRENRWVRRFAWFPVRASDIDRMLWLEWYWLRQQYELFHQDEFSQRGTWIDEEARSTDGGDQ